MTSSELQLEEELIEKLKGMKYEQRTDIRDRATLERNFREKLQALNRVSLTDAEFQRLLDEIVTPDVFTAAHTLRNRNAFTREWEKREAEIQPFPIQGARVGREAGIRAREQGDIENGNAPCGQSAALIREIVPAGEVVRRLVAEAEDVLARLAR